MVETIEDLRQQFKQNQALESESVKNRQRDEELSKAFAGLASLSASKAEVETTKETV